MPGELSRESARVDAEFTGVAGSGKVRHALAPYGRQWAVCGVEPTQIDGPRRREVTCRRCLAIIAKGALHAA